MTIEVKLTKRELEIILVSLGQLSVHNFNSVCSEYHLNIEKIGRYDDILFDTFKKIKSKVKELE